jgi:ParB/RepB/Spo0J family partition protein
MDYITKTLEDGVTRGNVYLADPRQLFVDWTKNISRGGQEPAVDDALIELAKDMIPKAGQGDNENGTSGQLNPILVRIGNPYQVVGGFRRMRAALWLVESGTCTDFKIKYTVSRMSDVEAALINISENLQREDPSPIQMAHAIRALNEDYCLDWKTIAGRLKKSQAWCKSVVDLVSLPTAIQDKIQTGKVSVGAGKALAAMPAQEQAQALQDAEEGGGVVTPAKVRKAREKASLVAAAVPLTAKQARTFFAERTPISDTEKRFNLMMVSFFDGDVNVDNMDRYLSDFHECYRGEILDSDD